MFDRNEQMVVEIAGYHIGTDSIGGQDTGYGGGESDRGPTGPGRQDRCCRLVPYSRCMWYLHPHRWLPKEHVDPVHRGLVLPGGTHTAG
jgi:hypothetical protein